MRNMSKWLAIGALLATGGTVLIAADTPATPPAEPAPTTKPARAAHLTKPWSELSDLSDDVKAQIIAIHEKANQDRDAINRKERADIEALLTDDQKKEVSEIEAKARAEEAAKRHHAHPATEPAAPGA
jgi:Spy/CpxP family protein refolding chaperone